MKNYAIYLRKSRIDAEAERAGQGETLARHRKALLDLAKTRGYNIVKIYEEIVSGETITSRPQMQALMHDVEQGLYTGVLVMEIERLARGDTIDQGLVAQTFKYSDTLIITPLKTYDPNNEFDEEFFEFGLFMSRREYKTINRRLQRGREASAKEGKWLASRAPYGYKRKPLENQKGSTLEIVENEAAVVRLIFDLYINGTDGRRLGIQSIARYLNEHNIPSCRYDYWQKATIRDILNNPVYAGKIRYGYRRTKRVVIDGQRTVSRPISLDENCIIVDGLHEAIISPETYEEAQKLGDLRPIMPVGYKKEIKSPLAGLVVCKLCGRKMSMRRATTPGRPDYLVCHARACPNVSSPLPVVELRVLDCLRDWLRGYQIESKNAPEAYVPKIDALKVVISKMKNDRETIRKQLSACYDLLESGVYTVEKFTERTRTLDEREQTITSDIERLTAEIGRADREQKTLSEFIPKVETVIEAYESTPTAAEKNALLREVLDHIEYKKDKSAAFRGVSVDDFELDIFPKLPDCE